MSKKTIPSVDDKRDKNKKSDNITISNYKELDKNKDKDTIDKILKDKQDALHNPNYSIDLNTNRVKQNNRVSFMVQVNKPKGYKPKDDNKGIYDLVYQDYLRLMHHFDKDLNSFLDKEYSDIQEVKDDIYLFNNMYDTNYYNGFNFKVKNLLDEDFKKDYINKYSDAVASTQYLEINNVCSNIIDFVNEDIDNTEIRKILSDEDLKDLQQKIKDKYSVSDASNDIAEFVDDFNKDDIEFFIFDNIKSYINRDVSKWIKIEIERNKDYYKEVQELYKTINDKILQIVDNFNSYYDKSTDIEIIDSKSVVKRDNIKLPKTYTIDFDIMRLFNNIYPNYKFKSIDDNRHKDLDIKAKLLLDIDSNTSDEITQFQNMRLVQFIKNGNIALYPIQSALINGFIDIRDNQDTIDKVIPFQSTLKHITQDKKMRFPKSKKDIQLYEDFMLFFDRCKIQVKIVDRATNSVVFEVMQPIPLLSNTQAYSNSSGMGYIIGNSILNILKNELDNLHTTPHQTTLRANKGYLSTKLPKTPTTINLSQYIDSKISQMINSYGKRGTYNGKVNIQPLYDFQALYNKHPKPTKDDKKKVREMLNKYLDEKIKNNLINKYDAINDKKEITQYKLEINKDAK